MPTLQGRTPLEWIGGRRDEMLALLGEWVGCESPSLEPERVAGFGARVGAAFAAAGATVATHRQGIEINVPGREGGGKPLLLLGHLDTVYPAGTLAAMPFRRDGDLVYGPGVFDMKGGLIQALFALRALRETGLRPRRAIRAWFVHDEETGSRASRPVTERFARASEAALVLEPAADEDGKLKTARKGIAHYTLRARGVAAHAGVDFEKGSSAITALAAALVEIAGWSDPGRGATINPGVIGGGTRANVVAEHAWADLDVRAWTLADLDAIDGRLRGLGLELAGSVNRPPMEATPAGTALFERARAIGLGLGLDLQSARTGGGSDGNFTAALGVPTLDGLGMAGGGAHAPGEHIRIDQLAARTALLARLLVEL